MTDAVTGSTVYYHQDLSVDQQLALRTAATRLAREFDGASCRCSPNASPSSGCTPSPAWRGTTATASRSCVTRTSSTTRSSLR
ncbi:hypothetical protein [Dactylosporangium sp. NPDC051541]|uniref:hypothetical protein n=1 Tax=Dactylosporangium sp. NPDC051541 TaxID=3363977 RepID=UPI00379A2E44